MSVSVYDVLAVFYPVVVSLIIMRGNYKIAAVQGETPVYYQVPAVRVLLGLSIILFLAATALLFQYSWKMLLVLFVVGILTAKPLLIPNIEKLLGYLMDRGILKRD